ncbi:hypothetical protein MLD38_003165 [Melastoma candidum]|uniref:Uncharacterized protein n=1 Tax=Melastoma candidum TaxID=119954 RepID=A0ACB9S1Y3_9MYRT|nr:hypothetical protein MLD38_003165 [Melastoma candidum]
MDLSIVLYTPLFLAAAFVVVTWLCALIIFLLRKIRRPSSLAGPQNDLEAGYHQHYQRNPDLADDPVALPAEVSPRAPQQVAAYDDSEKTNLVNDECVICLVRFEDGEVCRVLTNCKHVFHKECIDEWMSRSLCCPICRESAVAKRESQK